MWDAVNTIGVLSGLAGLGCAAVYVISIYKSDPRLILRFWDESNDGEQALIFGKETHLRFGISTKRSQPVLLTEVSIPITYFDKAKLEANDLFQTKAIATGSGLALMWTGEQTLEKKRFVMFEILFKGYFNNQSPPFNINITATAIVAPTTWRFPWSMFSPHKKKVDFTRLIQWKQEPEDSNSIGFRVEPGEACFIFGEAAKGALTAQGKEIDVIVNEVFDENKYKISCIRNKQKD